MNILALWKHRTRSNVTDKVNQDKYIKKLNSLFDISHAKADEMIKNEEDREILRLQRLARVGSIASVDSKLAAKEKWSGERKQRLEQCLQLHAETMTASSSSTSAVAHSDSGETTDDTAEDSDEESDVDFVSTVTGSGVSGTQTKRQRIISPTVLAVLDRTNTSIRKSTMVLASVVNQAGDSTSSVVLSKSTVHRQRQLFQKESAQKSQSNIVRWSPLYIGMESYCQTWQVRKVAT